MKEEELHDLFTHTFEEIRKMINKDPTDFRVEQLEYNPDGEVKSCVISFLAEIPSTELHIKFNPLQHGKVERLYKRVDFYENYKVKGIYIFNPK